MSGTVLTAVVPAYEEAEGLEGAIREISAALDRSGVAWQIVIVDDGSEDATLEIARRIAAADPRVVATTNGRNMGIGAAMRTGIVAGSGEYVVIIPADIAFDLAELPGLVAAARTCDVLVCVRSDRRDYTLFRKLASVVYIAFIRGLFGLGLRQFNYIHVYRRAVFERITYESSGVFFHAEVLVRAADAGFVLKEHLLRYVPRGHGSQKGARLATIRKTIRDAWRFRARRRRGETLRDAPLCPAPVAAGARS